MSEERKRQDREKVEQKQLEREKRKTGQDFLKLRLLQNTTEIVALQNKFAAHLTMFDTHRDYWVPN